MKIMKRHNIPLYRGGTFLLVVALPMARGGRTSSLLVAFQTAKGKELKATTRVITFGEAEGRQLEKEVGKDEDDGDRTRDLWRDRPILSPN